MSWPDGERYSSPLQSLVVSRLIFSQTGGVLFHQNSSIHRCSSIHQNVPTISTEKLVLLCNARCVPSRLRCNGHSLLLRSYQLRIGRIEIPSCSACGHPSQDTSHFILHCLATDSLRRLLSGDSLTFYNLWYKPLKDARLLGLHDLPPCSHPSERLRYQQQPN